MQLREAAVSILINLKARFQPNPNYTIGEETMFSWVCSPNTFFFSREREGDSDAGLVVCSLVQRTSQHYLYK